MVSVAASPLTGTDGDQHCEFTLDFEETKAPTVSQVRPDKVRLHILYHAEMAPIHGAWMAGELAHHGYKVSPDVLHPVLNCMQDEGLLRSDQQVVDGRARRVFDATPDRAVGAGAPSIEH